MLHVLLSFLRVKAIFERKVWLLRPRMMVHELLARMKRTKAAKRWQESLYEATKVEAGAILDLLNTTEKETGVRIISVRDRIENGFTASLAVDRLCSLVEPAMGEARKRVCHAPSELSSKNSKPKQQNPRAWGAISPIGSPDSKLKFNGFKCLKPQSYNSQRAFIKSISTHSI